jgi:bifunctional non-homologous end joining protein LigD
VATPIDWDELGRVAPGRYDLRAVLRRLQQKEDPWADILRQRRSLRGPRQALDAILTELGRRGAREASA